MCYAEVYYIYVMKRILFTGPESTGKSALAKHLAEEWDTLWVPEYARTYLEQLSRPYTEKDLLPIAKAQLQREDRYARKATDFLFIDTGMLVMKVWSEFKYSRCHPWILEQLYQRQYDLWVLCGIDIPWEPGPMRENPNEREELYAIYRQELQQLGVPFIELWGSREERVERMRKLFT
jgi:NadR type nicotinamide-nucleotide adenylyltransferase